MASDNNNREGFGHYEGRFVAEFLDDGRLVQLVEPFAFIDAFQMRWDVPSNWKVDGASIPRSLWTVVGSPFTGLYRDASVIHDYYCDSKKRPWGAVHRVFYDAMRASGVKHFQARLMYAAVCWGGPRWSIEIVNRYDEALQDYLGSSASGSNRVHYPMKGPEFDDISMYDVIITRSFYYPLNESDIKELEIALKEYDPADGSIQDFVDEQIRTRGLLPTPLKSKED